MLATDLAELHGVDDHAGVAVACVPDAVVLVAGLVAEADAVLDHNGMAADVEDGGQGLFDFVWQVEIGRDVESGHGLEVHFFHDVAVAFELAGLGGIQRGLFREGIEAEHFKELAAVFGGLGLPVCGGGDLRESVFCGDLACLLGEIAVDEPVSRGVRGLFRVGRSREEKGRQQAEEQGSAHEMDDSQNALQRQE